MNEIEMIYKHKKSVNLRIDLVPGSRIEHSLIAPSEWVLNVEEIVIQCKSWNCFTYELSNNELNEIITQVDLDDVHNSKGNVEKIEQKAHGRGFSEGNKITRIDMIVWTNAKIQDMYNAQDEQEEVPAIKHDVWNGHRIFWPDSLKNPTNDLCNKLRNDQNNKKDSSEAGKRINIILNLLIILSKEGIQIPRECSKEY